MTVSKATMDCVRRFPQLYKMQALQVIDKEVRDAINITADTFVMASMVVMIEHYGLDATNEDSINTFVKHLQDIVDFNADRYDDAVAEGLRNRLRNSYGIEYKG